MKIHQFQCDVWLPLPPEELFPFFSDAANLDGITPPWLHFRIVTPQPLEMRAGTLIDYKLKVRGMPLRWRTRIREWQPPHRFVDEQLRGPYRLWIHEHLLEARDGGTLARDVVRYAVPLDFLVHPLFVRRDVESLFAFRQEALRKKFGGRP